MADLVTAPDPDDDEWAPSRRRFGLLHRLVALVAAVAVLLAAVATVLLRQEGGTVEVFPPRGAGVVDLQRFSEAVGSVGPPDGSSLPAGPEALAAEVDLVVTGRITGFRAGRTEVLPRRLGLPDRRLVTMDVAVEEVVAGQLPAGSGGQLQVELGAFRTDRPTPAAIAAVAPRGLGVALYLRRAGDRSPHELRPPEGEATGGTARWWVAEPDGFLVADGRGGVVRVADGHEIPDTTLADLLPPNEVWPQVVTAPPLACDPAAGIAGDRSPGGPVLGAVDPPGQAAPPRSPTLEAALATFAATVRGFPPVEAVIREDGDGGPGYAIAFTSLTNRTVAFRDGDGMVQAVFFAGGTDETGWRVTAFQACPTWYEGLPPAPGDPDRPV